MAAVQRASRGMHRSSTAVATVLALLVVAPTPLAYAQGQVYGVEAIGRASLDVSGVEQSFIPTPRYSTGVAVDADHIYWASYDSSTSPGSYSIGRANLDGSGVEPKFISLPTQPGDVAVDAQHIYWTTGSHGVNAVGRANLDGSNVEPTFIAADTPYPRALAVDAQHVYWTTGTFDANTIARANLDGSSVEPHFIGLPGPYGSYGLAVDVDHIYWTNFSQSIGRANLDGSGVDPSFVTGLTGTLLGLTVDSDHIYWTAPRRSTQDIPPAGPFGSIGRVNLDGSGVEPWFVTGESHVVDVVVDAGHIYWVNQAEYVPCFHCEPPPDDTTPPNTVITNDPPNKTRKTRVSFEFASEDLEARFECRLDHKNWKPCVSPKTVSRLDKGRHTFRVRAVDPAGNADLTPARDKFRATG